MDFDLNETLAQMSNAVKDEVTDSWGLVQSATNDFFQTRKMRLELLADLRIKNEIDEDFFQKRLMDEKIILESELHAIAVISKAIAQRAANAAFKILENAINTVVSAVL